MKAARILPFALLVSLLLAACSTVDEAPGLSTQAQPESFSFQEEFSNVFDCGDFLAVDDYVLSVRGKTFFDKAGTPVRMQLHIKVEGIITNPESGKSLRDHAAATEFRNLQTGENTVIGSFTTSPKSAPTAGRVWAKATL